MRLLVTGMSGFLGYALGRRLHRLTEGAAGKAFEVTATRHEQVLAGFGGTQVSLDLADQFALRQILEEIRPQAVIHMAAISQPNLCETAAERTMAVNVDATATIAHWCANHGCPLVFTSTDLVFDGARPPYEEESPTNPLNAYGRQKVAAETALLERHPHAVVCRLPLIFGYGGPLGRSFGHTMVTAIAQGEPIRLFTDEFRTPLSTHCAAKALLAALDWPGGIYHLGGAERISRFGLGRRIARTLGVGEAHLQPLTQAELPMSAPRPADVSLRNRRARGLGFSPEGLDRAIERLLATFGIRRGKH
jgi:dTDP-4-dehydrorhamnose reductase